VSVFLQPCKIFRIAHNIYARILHEICPWAREPANVEVNNSGYCLYGLSTFSPYATYRLPHITVSTSGRVACFMERQVLLAAYFEVLAEYVCVVWVQLHVKHFVQKCTACTWSWKRLRSKCVNNWWATERLCAVFCMQALG